MGSIPAQGIYTSFSVNCLWFFCVIRIISEFEAIKKQALTKPEDTKEMMDLMQYVKNAGEKTLIQLNKDIKVLEMVSIEFV